MSTPPRFESPRPDDMTAEQRELYDLVARGPRASGPQLFALTDDEGRLHGPFGTMLLAPPVGAALQQLGVAIRYHSTLPARVRELAILLVAAHWDSDFERYAHEPVAASVGVTPVELAAVKALEIPVGIDAAESVALELTRALAVHGVVSDELYRRAEAALGSRQIYELTVLVGYYSTLALQLRTFRIASPTHGTG